MTVGKQVVQHKRNEIRQRRRGNGSLQMRECNSCSPHGRAIGTCCRVQQEAQGTTRREASDTIAAVARQQVKADATQLRAAQRILSPLDSVLNTAPVAGPKGTWNKEKNIPIEKKIIITQEENISSSVNERKGKIEKRIEVTYLGENNGEEEQDNKTQARDQTLATGTVSVISTEGSGEDQRHRGDTIANDHDQNLRETVNDTGTAVPDSGNGSRESAVGQVADEQPPDNSSVEEGQDEDVALLVDDHSGDKESSANAEDKDMIKDRLVVVVEAEATLVDRVLGGNLISIVVDLDGVFDVLLVDGRRFFVV